MTRRWAHPILVAALVIAGAHEAAAFSLRGGVLGNGGNRAAGGGRVLTGTAGQAAVGASGGARHRLCHGFWCYGGPVAVGVDEELPAATPAYPELEGPVPNPASGMATFSLALPAAAQVQLIIYDVLGRARRTVVDGKLEPGIHRLRLDRVNAPGSPEGSGVYYARLVLDGRLRTARSLVIIR